MEQEYQKHYRLCTMSLNLRFAAIADAEVIAGYNAAMALETEHITLDGERLLQGVRAVLGDATKGFYIVAESDGQVVGQMMITFEWSDWRNANFWWIQSVYVHRDFRQQGVFRSLYRFAMERAEQDPGVCGLRLYVEAQNHNAQRTYERLGMKRTPYRMYEVDFVLGRPEKNLQVPGGLE